jgi:subtilisin-like proprotein convertase family protein
VLSNSPSFTLTNLQADHTLNITFAASLCLQGTRFDSSTPMTIPDRSTNTSPLTVSGLTGQIAGVTVLFNITHTFDGDLKIDLIGPDGTTVNLVNRRGGGGHDFGVDCLTQSTLLCDSASVSITTGTAPFIGAFIPEQALSAFIGKNGSAMNGQWGLRVADMANGDSGQLNCWSLIIRTTP